MSTETIKYNPANFTPEHLFRSPTASTHTELSYLVKQLSRDLEGGDRVKDRLLLVGSELEILFFSPEMDPYLAAQRYYRDNPNYRENHVQKIGKLMEFGDYIKHRRPKEFMATENPGRICLEFHTTPQGVGQHLKTMERFGDLLRDECKRLDVLPVIHSEHIHVSLRNNPLNEKLCSEKGTMGMVPSDKIAKSAFSRVAPLMLLPEEWFDRRWDPHFIKEDGIVSRRVKNLDHPEFRMLSSEYAFDPILNLVVSLRAMHAGCINPSKVSSVEYVRTYLSAVWDMSSDSELAKFFGESTLLKLCRIVRQYPAVSRREITVDQISK